MNEENITDLKNWLFNNLKTKKIYSIHRWLKNDFLTKIENKVFENYNFLPKNKSELIYLFLNEKIEPFCKKGNKKIFNSFEKGYRNFCSNSCECKKENQSLKIKIFHENNLEKTKEAIRKTREKTKKKYGVLYPLQNRELKEKAIKTNIIRYGDSHFLKTENGKSFLKNRLLEKYGVDNIRKLKNIDEKIKQTNLKKYGVENPFQIENKIKQTNLKKYGVENPAQNESIKKKIKQKLKEFFDNKLNLEKRNEKIQKTTFEKWGVYHPKQKHLKLENIKALENKEWVKEQMINNYLTVSDIAKITGYSKSHLYKIFKKFSYDEFLYRFYSLAQKEIYDFCINILKNDNEEKVILNDRKNIFPNELDVFIEKRRIAIEFCGLFWHSEKMGNKDKFYHLKKLEKCKKNNIKLVTIFSNEWEENREEIENKLKYILTNNEIQLFEKMIGNDKIIVDRKWSEGDILKNYGYVLKSIIEPKPHFIKKGYYKILENFSEDVVDFIWDCGWLVYERSGNR